MARMTLATGLCPICGRTARRTLTAHHGLASETYLCPEHGRREAHPTGWTVAEWAAPSMLTLGEMLELRPVPSWAR